MKIHEQLVAAIQSTDKYSSDWKSIAEALPKLVRSDGFHYLQASLPDSIRRRLAGAKSIAKVLRAAAKAEGSLISKPSNNARARALLLKTLAHLYHYETAGERKLWILSLPSVLTSHPIEFANETDALVDQVLNATTEAYSDEQKRRIDGAVATALRWVERGMIVAGDPNRPEHKALLKRWFIPSTHADVDGAIAAFMPTLRRGLLKIAIGLKVGDLIILDDPAQRGTGSTWEQSEAYTFTRNDVRAVWVEPGFWGNGNTLTGATNWARIIVHELTHNYCQTADHSYSWQGLLPRESDVFRRVNNARVALQPGFAAVRTLSMGQCQTNADSWAFFCADAVGALTDRDRIAALGNKLYEDTGWTAAQKVERKLVTQ
ncbi:M35 family metallo-endopeptidase [Roseateles sp.]|uniref:M35 family metallo-endopeptidase n=1 Tax=Roseateles sp. TaxID=1971397 RepID=UPI003264C55A